MAVRYEVIDEIARITLDRPETANSVTVDIALAIDAEVRQFATDDQARALAVTGVGDRSFCAGGANQDTAPSAPTTPNAAFAWRGADTAPLAWYCAFG